MLPFIGTSYLLDELAKAEVEKQIKKLAERAALLRNQGSLTEETSKI